MPSDADIRTLRDLAGAMCSFPDCGGRESLQEAHIAAKKPGGKRFDSEMSSKVRDGYDNLILLCANHHLGVVDRDEATYTVEALHEMKRRHEESITTNRKPMTELAGEIRATATDADSVIGADIQGPTKIAPGTRITADGRRVRNVTGVRIGGDHAE